MYVLHKKKSFDYTEPQEIIQMLFYLKPATSTSINIPYPVHVSHNDTK